MKDLKQYAHYHVPLMEGPYCTNDDYQFLAERLQYKFVPKGHYAIRQGELGDACYFII